MVDIPSVRELGNRMKIIGDTWKTAMANKIEGAYVKGYSSILVTNLTVEQRRYLMDLGYQVYPDDEEAIGNNIPWNVAW